MTERSHILVVMMVTCLYAIVIRCKLYINKGNFLFKVPILGNAGFMCKYKWKNMQVHVLTAEIHLNPATEIPQLALVNVSPSGVVGDGFGLGGLLSLSLRSSSTICVLWVVDRV